MRALLLLAPHDWIEKINALSTCVIAVFTALLFWAVLWQIRTSRAIERAWIVMNLNWSRTGAVPRIQRIHIKQASPSDRIMVALSLTCRNSGRSIARIHRIWARAFLSKGAPKQTPEKSSLSDHGTMQPIAPNDSSTRSLQVSCDGVQAEDDHIYVYVVLEYGDVFERVRETSGFWYVISDEQLEYVGRLDNHDRVD
jgi:hypothetical protein